MLKIINGIVLIVLIVMVGNLDSRTMVKQNAARPVVRRDLQAIPNTPFFEIKNVVSPIEKEIIMQRLDKQLNLPLDSVWEDDQINNLFDLAKIDPTAARDYFKKIHIKMINSIPQPSDVVTDKPIVLPKETLPIISVDEPMKKAIGRQAPPKKFGDTKVEEVPVIPTEEEPMKIASKKGGAPLGGPKKPVVVGEAKEPSSNVKNIPIVAPKVVEQIFSVSKLKDLPNDKLIELFEGLLEALPKSWNNQVVEKVEEKTKYGSKVYNVYGAPLPKWLNDINTLKKVFISKNIISEEEITKRIADRIIQVRVEKNVKPPVTVVVEEKPKEELTEQDLVRLIKGLLSLPQPDQIGWVVSVKGNIKALDKINHNAALEYHNRFVTLTKEKPFLK